MSRKGKQGRNTGDGANSGPGRENTVSNRRGWPLERCHPLSVSIVLACLGPPCHNASLDLSAWLIERSAIRELEHLVEANHVHEAMAAHIEGYYLVFLCLLALQGLVNGAGNTVG